MKHNELIQLATQTSRDVIQKNLDVIHEKIKNTLKAEKDDGKLSQEDALAKAIALAFTTVPEISAAVTAKMLVKLGLVEIEDAE